MHAWEAIQNSLNYIEDHLSENIKMETLANVAALSPYYFQRLFGRLVKKPVNEYVKLRRLAKASEALKNKEKRIIDVALDYGFSDHANFTRAFKEAYGITPDEYRGCPVILNQFIKPDLLLNYITVDEDVPLIADGIVVEVTRRKLDKPRTFIGIEGEVPVTELTRGKATGIATTGIIWDEFHRQKPNILHLLPNGNELGVLYMEDAREGCCTYMAGAEATENVQVEEYASYTLACGEYKVCCFEAENFAELIGSAIFKASSFMNSWMKKHSLTCGNFTAEMYYDTNPDASYMELWLPLSTPRRMIIKETWDKTNGTQKPSLATISAYVKSPLFERLCKHVEIEYQSKPVLEYSRCSMQYGWNVKYKKAGRTLCTLYPMEGYYIALIVIGDREQTETELMLPFFTGYLQQLYHETKTGMGQKWLMINVTDDAVLEDVKQCIAIRRGKKKEVIWR
jgi:AraC family transcriptional regulator